MPSPPSPAKPATSLQRSRPSLDPESQLLLRPGVTSVAGLDEAGRGALAGPVCAAAVILPPASAALLSTMQGVNDSKQLTPLARERLFPIICNAALAHGVGFATSEEIDRLGIVPATHAAMLRALEALRQEPDALLIDGMIHLPVATPQEALVRGDSRSLSIAAASILAKVSRDRYMIELDARYPAFGFAAHKGYGTALHMRAIAQAGPCPEHRLSFAPLNAGQAG